MKIIKNGFVNERLGIELDVYTIDEKEWFRAKDVSDYLGYQDTNKMMRSIEVTEDNCNRQTLSGVSNNKYQADFINESALYEIIFSITKRDLERYNKAREFQKWVFSEVLPSIRKNGFYVDNNNITEEQYRKLIIEAKDLAQQKDNFSNILMNNTRKSQMLKTYLEQMFPNVADVYVRFLDNMKSAKMLDDDYYPTELFKAHNSKKNMFKYHQTIGTNKAESFSLTNIGMNELARRLYVENGELKIKKAEVQGNLTLF
ncbi:MAG: BRO-N domain-containing protein [Cetobacterium sp.]